MNLENCNCNALGDIGLSGAEISARVKNTRALKARLSPRVQHPDREHRLLQCTACSETWQRSIAWGWGAKEYLFRTPPTSDSDWLVLPYVDPDEIIVFVSSIDRFIDKGSFRLKQEFCAHAGCLNKAIFLSVHCLPHHIEALQSAHLLPHIPSGRWFGPYKTVGPDTFLSYVASKQALLSSHKE